METLDVCEDCHNYIEADLDALAHHYSEEEYKEVIMRCEDAFIAYRDLIMDSQEVMGRKLKMVHYMYDQSEEIDFTWKDCELCFSSLGGKRHHYNIMGFFNESA